MNKIAAVLLVLFGVLLPSPQPAPPFEWILAGGRVVDGTGAPWFVADVGVRNGRIAACLGWGTEATSSSVILRS